MPQRQMLRLKIHTARVTETQLEYQGSVAIDQELMEEADILPGEQLHVLNMNNGARFITYAITGDRGSGVICLNGPSARLAQVGDVILLLSYISVSEDEARKVKPRIIHLDENNRIIDK